MTTTLALAYGTLIPGVTSSTRRSALPHLRDVPRETSDLWVPVPAGVRNQDEETRLLGLLNAHRATLSGVSAKPLLRDTGGALDLSAVWKDDDMAGLMYLAHDQGPIADGHPPVAHHPSTISDRFIGCGYSPYLAWGENIAYGFQSAADVFDAFQSDVGHRQNQEGPWSYVGLACVQAPNGLMFWVEDFGTDHCPAGPTPPAPSPSPTDPAAGETWRKKAAHRFVVDVDVTALTVRGKRVYAHHPGEPPRTLDWALSTFRRNFEKVG